MKWCDKMYWKLIRVFRVFDGSSCYGAAVSTPALWLPVIASPGVLAACSIWSDVKVKYRYGNL